MSEKIDYTGGLTLSMPVTDLDQSIGWYERVLGFKLLYRVEELGWCELASSVERVNVGLSVVENPEPGGATPTFGVLNIDAARSALQAADVRLDGDIVVHEGMVKLQTFYDPDGNSLMFYQEIGEQGE